MFKRLVSLVVIFLLLTGLALNAQAPEVEW